MAVERGQRTTVRFGGVRAEVSLVKTSGKPAGMPEHETKRVLAPQSAQHHPEVDRSRALVDPFGDDGPRTHRCRGAVVPVEVAESIPAGSPVMADSAGMARVFADPRLADRPMPVPATDAEAAELLEQQEAERIADDVAAPVTPDRLRELRAEADARRPAADPLAGPVGEAPKPGLPAEYVPPETTVQQGVHLADGTWLDLTDRLREVDDRTKVEGVEVIATIASNVVPRERVRDAHYVATADTKTSKVLALLWHGLREGGAAAVVRWTKKTQQTLGIIVARGTLGRGAHLILLELEWSENMRAPGPRALEPITARVESREVAAALELVEAFAASGAVLDDVRDMRRAKRGELLELARAGKLEDYVPPAQPVAEPEAPDLASQLAASAAARR